MESGGLPGFQIFWSVYIILAHPKKSLFFCSLFFEKQLKLSQIGWKISELHFLDCFFHQIPEFNSEPGMSTENVFIKNMFLYLITFWKLNNNSQCVFCKPCDSQITWLIFQKHNFVVKKIKINNMLNWCGCTLNLSPSPKMYCNV